MLLIRSLPLPLPWNPIGDNIFLGKVGGRTDGKRCFGSMVKGDEM